MTEASRRDFLRPGRFLAEIGGREPPNFVQTPPGHQAVVRLRREAMACLFEIQFSALEKDRRAPVAALEFLEVLEDQLSIYRQESELSLLNRAAAHMPVPVEERLYQLLFRCRSFWEETARAFDVSAGPLIHAWGFEQRQGRVPDASQLADAIDRVGMEKVRFDAANQTVAFVQSGMSLNLGAIGKGYALDRLAERLKLAGFGPALMSAGHSSVLAIGQPPWDDAWRVDVPSPTQPRVRLATVDLVDAALSTSGISEQNFVVGGRRYGHLIDPRSGQPAEGMLQATVRAPDAAWAEALSTAMFLNGADWALDYCAKHPEVSAILLPTGKTPVFIGAWRS